MDRVMITKVKYDIWHHFITARTKEDLKEIEEAAVLAVTELFEERVQRLKKEAADAAATASGGNQNRI